MLDFHVSIVPFFVIAAANFILSWLYYSPPMPWFRAWQIGVGIDPDKTEMTEEDKKSMPRLMIGAVAASILLSYGLQVIIHSVGGSFLTGLMVGFIAWFTFALTHSLNTQFEGRKPLVLVINNVLYLVTYCLYGGLIAVWQ